MLSVQKPRTPATGCLILVSVFRSHAFGSYYMVSFSARFFLLKMCVYIFAQRVFHPSSHDISVLFSWFVNGDLITFSFSCTVLLSVINPFLSGYLLLHRPSASKPIESQNRHSRAMQLEAEQPYQSKTPTKPE